MTGLVIKKGVIFLGCIIIFTAGELSQTALSQGLYEKGVEQIENGQADQALLIWLDARNRSMEEAIDPDPRIGFRFIELVTERGLTEYYPQASDIYFWGLSGSEVGPYKEEVKEELERLRPLINNADYARLSDLIQDEDPLIYREFINLWSSLDFRPATAENERLLEHWERIAEARERFTINRLSAYGTDARGSVFVQYGQPDRIIRNLGYQFQEYRGSLTRVSSGGVARTSVDTNVEIWIYPMEAGAEDEVPFFFGPDGDLGGFDRLTSITQLIPTVGIRSMRMFGANDPQADALLKLYERLAGLDPYFANQYYNLEHRVFSSQISARELNPSQNSSMERLRNRSHSRSLYRLAPQTVSTVESSIASMDQTISQYRYLDSNNEPYTVMLSYVDPYEPVLFHLMSDYEGEWEEQYRLTSTFTITNSENSVEEKLIDEPMLTFEEDANGDYLPLHSYFVFRPFEEYRYRVSYELTDRHITRQTGNRWTSNEGILALSNEDLSAKEPLSVSGDELVMSDLLLGYVQEDDTPNHDYILPFYVPKNHEFILDSRLFVKYELYNLSQDGEGNSRYDVDIRIDSDRSALRDLFSTDTQFTQGVSNESAERTSSNILEIVTRELSPGNYQLVLEATDQLTGNTVERRAPFTIKASEGLTFEEINR